MARNPNQAMTSPKNRNRAIRNRIKKGMPLTEIGKEFGISGTRVAQIRDGKVGGRTTPKKAEDQPPKPRVRHHAKKQTQAQEIFLAYAWGKLETWIESFASESGISREAIAKRFSELLSGRPLR